jgi:DNA-binding GntR family transcriptional regulator
VKSLRTESLADVAYARLKRQIVFHELPPGQTFDELSISRHLKIGRSPVREAVQRLAGEGLVRVIPRKGAIVAELGMDTVREMFEARVPCETQIARLAAMRAEPADIARMEAALAEGDRLAGERRFRELLLADEEFHLALAAAAKNKLLYEMLVRLYTLGLRFWYTTVSERPAAELKREIRLHHDVLRWVKRRDPEKAARAALKVVDPNRVTGLVHAGNRLKAA